MPSVGAPRLFCTETADLRDDDAVPDRRHQAALSMDERIVRENETRTSQFGDEHAFVIGDVKTFGVVRESCAFDVAGKIDGHGVGE